MKKYLISLILFISAFIIFVPNENVKANEINKHYTYSSSTDININYNNKVLTVTNNTYTSNNIYTKDLSDYNYFLIVWYQQLMYLYQSNSPLIFNNSNTNQLQTSVSNQFVKITSYQTYYFSSSYTGTTYNDTESSIYSTVRFGSFGDLKNAVMSWDQAIYNFDLYDNNNNLIKSANVSTKVVNKVIDLGDNTFGFYQDYVGLNLTSLTGAVDTLSVVCEEDRPFNNNYCYINYTDLINHNSDISVFEDYGVSFTQLFGDNTGYLLNDRYYLYSFRIQKPFVPQVGNLFINSLTNNSNQVNILGVYLQDGGSYTDYVIKFKISNSDYTTSTSLNDIMVVFRDGLSNYFTTIPTSFNYSVYRSFKLQYFSTEPTMEQVNNFYNSRDLSTIDGISSNNSFFTDNDFNTYGFGGIITAPFRFLYAIENYQTCSDIVFPFPHSNDTITLKCVRNTIPSSISPLITILQLILSGFICYRIAVETLSIIKDISSPDDANIEVVDL